MCERGAGRRRVTPFCAVSGCAQSCQSLFEHAASLINNYFTLTLSKDVRDRGLKDVRDRGSQQLNVEQNVYLQPTCDGWG